mgnify:CR=1 FL=1
MRMTDNYNSDASSWRGRVFLLKFYGSGYNYFYFGFADNNNGNHNF